jgi:hypothetical protein
LEGLALGKIMKLKEWADMTGIKYLTAYRWFKDGKLPVPAYQSQSGTIIVQDESLEKSMTNEQTNPTNDVMSAILKKTVELSKNNASIEDFAAYILSNFSLKPNDSPNHPRYSRNKPKPEDIQKHFQQFLKPKGEKPKPNNVLVADDGILDELTETVAHSAIKEMVEHYEESENPELNIIPQAQNLLKDLTQAFAKPGAIASLNDAVKNYGSQVADSIVNRIESTPQSINYTDSTSNTISDLAPVKFASSLETAILAPTTFTSAVDPTGAFKPTQKEIESVAKAMEKVATQLHTQAVKSRRGRKSKK